MNCKKCNKPNREQAKFCKWCGEPIAAGQASRAGKPGGTPRSSAPGSDPLDELFDKDDIREVLAEIIANASRKAEFCRRNGIRERMQLSFLITGESGTGKSATAAVIARALHSAGIVRTAAPEVITPINFENWVEDIDDHAEKLGNTVVVIEEAHKLVPAPDSAEIAQLDYILEPVRKWRDQSDRPVVIINGDMRLREYFDKNPQAASAINYSFGTGTISVDGLIGITELQLSQKYHRQLTDNAREKLRRIFVNDRRNPDDAPGAGGHNAASRAYNIDLAALKAGETGPVHPDLVEGKEFIPKSFNEIMAEFNKYVGVDEVKEAIRTIAVNIREDLKAGRPARVNHHYQFLGNPGTGKTTMARLFAEALNALGALSIGHLVEVTKDHLVSSFVGDTSRLVTEQFRKAEGGVLFIDEAYQLINDSHGKDAVDTMMTHLVDCKGKMVCIIAGYTKEMGEFMKSNSGLPSRFDRTINFRDYTAAELTEIFRRRVNSAQPYIPLSPEADAQVEKYFQHVYNTRTAGFGNARVAVNIYTAAVENMHRRLDADPASGYFLTMADIEGEDDSKKQSVDEVLAELDDMVGMDKVKDQLRRIAVKVRNSRRRQELSNADAVVQNVHIAVTGNPGTGKTEVAKRLGKIFKAMGILPKGHVVERERKTLLDSMANSAGANMDKAVDEALGGVLFIDEAYNLIPMDNPQDKDKDGVAAVEALMTRMSNDKGKFVTVIAGYKDKIDEFIANANPGLERRFTHRIHIDDYTAPQLAEIYIRAASKQQFRLTPEARERLLKKIEEMVTMKPRNFGNAGTILKLLDETIERHDDRIGDEDVSADALVTIEAADIPYDPPKKIDMSQCMKDLDRLVGLKKVKEAVHRLADAIVMEQHMAEAEGRRPKIPLHHYLFVGNPGTGKTTVARIMGNIFYSLGLLPSNKVVEVKPADLVVGFIGHTAPKTRQQFERGLGGVFFIDEAYGLKETSFGNDATNELLTLLNDNEGKVVCIAAGYPREIQQWLDTNTGTERRFKERIEFEDYEADELAEIFIARMKADGRRLDPGAESEMRAYMEEQVRYKGPNFGNAAVAVTYYEKVKVNQGARLRREMDMSGFDRSEMYTLRREDMILQ